MSLLCDNLQATILINISLDNIIPTRWHFGIFSPKASEGRKHHVVFSHLLVLIVVYYSSVISGNILSPDITETW